MKKNARDSIIKLMIIFTTLSNSYLVFEIKSIFYLLFLIIANSTSDPPNCIELSDSIINGAEIEIIQYLVLIL
jgi:hypothetical protein